MQTFTFALLLVVQSLYTSAQMWKGSGRSLFRTLILENFKFSLFVITPIFTAGLFWNDKVVEAVVRNRQYIVYPPEAERLPQNREELQAALEKVKLQKKNG